MRGIIHANMAANKKLAFKIVLKRWQRIYCAYIYLIAMLDSKEYPIQRNVQVFLAT